MNGWQIALFISVHLWVSVYFHIFEKMPIILLNEQLFMDTLHTNNWKNFFAHALASLISI